MTTGEMLWNAISLLSNAKKLFHIPFSGVGWSPTPLDYSIEKKPLYIRQW